MTGELRTAAELERWLELGLALRRIAPADAPGDASGDLADGAAEDDDVRVGRALTACANELPALPPPGVIADIATLLTGGRPAGADRFAGGPGSALAAAIRAYDDDVVARLVATPRFDDVVAAYAHTAAADRGAAVALIVAAICDRAGFTGVVVSPAALRRAIARLSPGGDHGGPAGPDAATVADELAGAYHRLARGARQCRALVDDRDVFAVDHVAVLRDLGSRMTATHLTAAAAAITQRLPRRLPARRELRGAHATRLADDSLYPAGGFASITPGGATTGNIENLVSSELAYMEDGEPVDLFSLRYIEGELLHYTRDDSEFRRHHHVIGIVLAADLDGARVVDRGLPWQRLILALGLAVAAIRWLAERLGEQALTVHLGFPPAVLTEEREICSLLLEAEIARGAVVIAAQPAREAIDRITHAGGGAIADLVMMSRGAPPTVANGVRALHVDLADPVPVLRSVSPRAVALAEPADPLQDPWAAWCDRGADLLRWLM